MTLRPALVASMLAAAITFAACGDDDDDGNGGDSPASLSITTDEQGIRAPESVEAGLTTITLENAGKDDHEAQLIRIDEAHTHEDVLSSSQARARGYRTGLPAVAVSGRPSPERLGPRRRFSSRAATRSSTRARRSRRALRSR